jgi:hypothetical protein
MGSFSAFAPDHGFADQQDWPCIVNASSMHRDRLHMPTSETVSLEAQIEALISKASDLPRQHRDDVGRNAESAHDQAQDVKTTADGH